MARLLNSNFTNSYEISSPRPNRIQRNYSNREIIGDFSAKTEENSILLEISSIVNKNFEAQPTSHLNYSDICRCELLKNRNSGNPMIQDQLFVQLNDEIVC